MDSVDRGREVEPFGRLNGGPPLVYVPRPAVAAVTAHLSASLEAGRFPGAVSLAGSRGAGKTVELRRLADALLEAGVMPVRVRLDGFNDPAELVLRAYLAAADQGPVRRSRTTKITGKGGVPGVAELAIESQRTPQLITLRDELEVRIASSSMKPTVFLVDEGDLFTVESFERAVVGALDLASFEDLPLGFVFAGTTRAFMRATYGWSSFVHHVVEPIHLRPLTTDESVQLLTATAATVNEHWDAHDLAPVIASCIGIPRNLQSAGRLVLEADSQLSVRQRCEAAAVSIRSSRGALVNTLLSGPERALYVQLSALIDTGIKQWHYLVSGLADPSLQGSLESMDDALEGLSGKGIIDVDPEGRVTLLIPTELAG